MTSITQPASSSARKTKAVLLQENDTWRRRWQLAQTLADLAKRASTGESVSSIDNEAVREISGGVGAESVALFRVDAACSTLSLSASIGLTPSDISSIPLDSLDDLAQIAERGTVASGNDCQDLGASSPGGSLVIPLVCFGTTVGLLCICRLSPFSEDSEISLLEGIAAQLAGVGHVADVADKHRHEMQFAHALKSELLKPRVPEINSMRTSMRLLRCLEGGGDFHDFVPYADGWRIAIGESSGRGVRAGLNLAHLMPLLRGEMLARESLIDVMDVLNSAVLEHGGRGQMVSLTLLEVHPASRQLRLCRAGGGLALLRRQFAFESLDEEAGTPLGVLASLPCKEMGLVMGPGDAVIVSTDGIYGLSRAQGETFRLDAFLHRLRQDEQFERTEEELADLLLRRLMPQGSVPMPDDDVTLFTLECLR